MKTLVQGPSVVKLKVLGVQFHGNKLLPWMISCESCCKILRPQLEEHLWRRFEVRIGSKKKSLREFVKEFYFNGKSFNNLICIMIYTHGECIVLVTLSTTFT